MSTDVYLVCDSHNPPLRADSESGQHLSDLDQIREDIANRDLIVAASKIGMEFDDFIHFQRATARFLCEHPTCTIGIVDEYGERHSIEGDQE